MGEFTIYTNKRMKGKLKGMSPAQYRVHSSVTA
ncbi:IS3 family transposase [Lysinibacillus fusiformis]